MPRYYKLPFHVCILFVHRHTDIFYSRSSYHETFILLDIQKYYHNSCMVSNIREFMA